MTQRAIYVGNTYNIHNGSIISVFLNYGMTGDYRPINDFMGVFIPDGFDPNNRLFVYVSTLYLPLS